MKIEPSALKGALRLIGTVLVACRAVPLLGGWGELCSTVGVALIAWAMNGPGSVSATDYSAIMNAALQLTPKDAELRIRRTPLPPVPTEPKVVVDPISK